MMEKMADKIEGEADKESLERKTVLMGDLYIDIARGGTPNGCHFKPRCYGYLDLPLIHSWFITMDLTS